MTIFGIEETEANKNKFVPHYKVLANKLYPNSHLHLLNPRSVMFTRSAFETFDFWNMDTDFFFAEDALSFSEMHNVGSNHFAYFSLFLKVLRVAHSLYDEDLLDCKWTKNKAHLMDIYTNMMLSDVVMVSPILKGVMDDKLGNLLSSKTYQAISDKYLVLPPPDLYKFEPPEGTKKSFKTLTFLWNHRFSAVKNPKLFFSVIENFHKAYPKVPIKILILSSLKDAEVLGHVPESIRRFVEIRPYAYDDAAYEKALKEANITIGTALAESYGIAILETARYGSVVLNADCNWAYTKLVAQTTCKPKLLPEKILKVYEDKSYRDRVLTYTQDQLSRITTTEQYKAKITKRLTDVFNKRLDRTSTKSPKLAAVMKALDKKGSNQK